MNHDPETIRRLVAEVVARVMALTPAAALAPAPASAPAAGGVTLADRVITLATVERLPAGTQRLLIAATAVVTPSAREHARDIGLEIVRGMPQAAAVAAARLFIVAHAECGGDAPGRCATIARSIPGAHQLPATGLADVVAAIATHASRDGARAVLLCTRPAAASALANRSTSLRAVTARDAAGLLAAAAECGANLLVVDPRAFSPHSLDRACGEFARRDLGPAPIELSAPPTPCACQGHAH